MRNGWLPKPGRTASQTNEERRVILGLAPGAVNTSYMTDDRWTQPGHPGLRYIDWQDEGFPERAHAESPDSCQWRQ